MRWSIAAAHDALSLTCAVPACDSAVETILVQGVAKDVVTTERGRPMLEAGARNPLIGHSMEGPEIPDRGPCSWSWGRGPRPPGWAVRYRLVVLTLAAAPRQVARCRARCPASAPAPVIIPTGGDAASAPVPAFTPGPGCRRSGPCCLRLAPRRWSGTDISRRAGHSGLSGGGRPVSGAFTRRLSAAVRRRRSGSILAVSVVPRRRKAAHRYARIAILATAARCRCSCRRPAACRRG